MTSKTPASYLTLHLLAVLLRTVAFTLAYLIVTAAWLTLGAGAVSALLFIATHIPAAALLTMSAVGLCLFTWAQRQGGMNPVLVEARERGDYSYFAEQLRRSPRSGAWRARDVKRALPVIDQWAREHADKETDRVTNAA